MVYQRFGYSGVREWFAFYSIKYCRLVLELIADLLFAVTVRLQSKGSLPDVTDEVLLDGAVRLAEKIRGGQVTSLAVVQAYIKRIEAVNPVLRCISDHRFERALKTAKEVDALLRRPDVDLDELKEKRPFLGVPFTVKEAVKLEGCAHTVGLHFLRNQKAERDSEAVLAMMEAGAIPIGTTTIPEMCSWWETNNLINGLTRNPHDLRYSAGGSSGGEGCAIAACGSPMGLGTDLGGSIRIPCLFNGICGHKPSGGVVSNGGHSPELTGEMGDYFVIGPMARRMEDVREMMKVLAKPSGVDLKLDRKVDPKKLRYFYFESTGDPMIHETDAEMLGPLNRVIDHLKAAYGVSVEKVELRDLRYAFQMWGQKVTRGTMQNGDLSLKSFLNDQKGEVSWLAEWSKLFIGRSNHTYPLLFHAALQGTMSSFVDTPYGQFLDERCEALKEEVEKLLGDDGVLIFPTFPHTALPHKKSYFYFASHGYTGFVNILKLPATHLPVGFSKGGLPLGITIAAARNQDALTLAIAHELEKKLGGYVPPCPVVVSGKGRVFCTELNDVTVRRRGSVRSGGD